MNYKPLILQKLKEFSSEQKEMSFAEILYSILRKKHTNSNIKKTSDLLKIKDEDIYISIEKCIEEEKED